MPAKKKAEEKAVTETVTEKKTVKKPAAKKTAKKTAAAADKTAAKTTAKKPAAKKTVKKTAVKAEAVPVMPKKSVQDYKDIINWKKGEAHSWNWLYIEVNAGDLLTEVEAGADNMAACVEAIKDCMLEGDYFIVEADDASLSVRYYTDNLSEWRRKYSEVNG